MYINPFVAGVVTTILAEVIVLTVAIIVSVAKKKKK